VAAEQSKDQYTDEAVTQLAKAADRIFGVNRVASAYAQSRLLLDLQELQEELEFRRAIAAEAAFESRALEETKGLLVLLSQRHAAELPRAHQKSTISARLLLLPL
jgi:hypothetical protein